MSSNATKRAAGFGSRMETRRSTIVGHGAKVNAAVDELRRELNPPSKKKGDSPRHARLVQQGAVLAGITS